MDTIETKLNQYPTVPGFECPAEFWPALGYHEEARYVSIWWTPSGDEACWCDGRRTLVGANWPTYLALLDHNFEFNNPANRVLGSSDSEATHHLVIDRLTGRAWLIPANDAETVLRRQHPVPEPDGDATSFITFDQLVAALQSMPQWEPPSIEQIEASMRETEKEFRAFLQALGKRKKAQQ